MPDGRSSPARKQALRDQMAARKRDPETHKILASDTGFDSLSPARPGSAGTSDFDPTPTDALEPGDLGAPILSRTSHEAQYVRATRAYGSSRVRNKQERQSAHHPPHVDLTPTRRIAQFDLAPRPVQPVPLSMKQTHSGGNFVSQLQEIAPADALSTLATAKQTKPEADMKADVFIDLTLGACDPKRDRNGAAFSGVELRSATEELACACSAKNLDAAKKSAQRLLLQGRVSRADMRAFMHRALLVRAAEM